MDYNMSVKTKLFEASTGRRMEAPQTQIPLIYRAAKCGSMARFDGKNYTFDLDGPLAWMLEDGDLAARFDFELWDEHDPQRPDARISAIILEDKKLRPRHPMRQRASSREP